MKKITLLLLLSSCALEPTAPQGGSNSYSGYIVQHLINKELQRCPITITYKDSVGTFYTKELHTFFTDSIRVLVIDNRGFHGYLFPSDVSFDTAFKWAGTNLLAIDFRIESDSLNGRTPSDKWGFWYSFQTSKVFGY